MMHSEQKRADSNRRLFAKLAAIVLLLIPILAFAVPTLAEWALGEYVLWGRDAGLSGSFMEILANSWWFWVVAGTMACMAFWSGGNSGMKVLASVAFVPLGLLGLFLLFAPSLPDELRIRSYTSQTRSEIRRMNTLLLEYQMQTGHLPESVAPPPGGRGRLDKLLSSMPTVRRDGAFGSKVEDWPRDWTVPGEGMWGYLKEGEFFLIIGAGPDQDYDLTLDDITSGVLSQDDFIDKQYDSTNGTFSSGDLF